jgi:hypothetical protein
LVETFGRGGSLGCGPEAVEFLRKEGQPDIATPDIATPDIAHDLIPKETALQEELNSIVAQPTPSTAQFHALQGRPKQRWQALYVAMVGILLVWTAVLCGSYYFRKPLQQQLATPQLSPEEHAFLANKGTFHIARKAAQADTFEGADLLLNQIAVGQVSDPQVAAYVAFSKTLSSYCQRVGIPRCAHPTWRGIIMDIPPVAVASELLAHPVETIRTGLEIKRQLPMYDDLDDTLLARYGKE